MVYIKGATADPWVRIISDPNINRIIIAGNNQYFFLCFKKRINSIKNDILI